MKTFTTGQLAERTNVNLETIRFYERKGLLPEPPRNKSGHRQYSIKDLRRTEFIIRTKSLGFSLQEISDLLSLRMESGAHLYPINFILKFFILKNQTYRLHISIQHVV